MMRSELQRTLKDLGEYRAEVVSIEDPNSLLRAQVRILGLWDDIDSEKLPWAEIKFPIGTRKGEGLFMPVQVGDLVWIDFINGDTRYPRITGACHYAPGGTVDGPEEAEAGMSLLMTVNGFKFEISPKGILKVNQVNSENSIQLSAEGLAVNADVPITINGNDAVNVTAKGAANIESESTINIKGAGNVSVEGDAALDVKAASNLSLEAGNALSVKGASVNLDASGPIVVKGSVIKLN